MRGGDGRRNERMLRGREGRSRIRAQWGMHGVYKEHAAIGVFPCFVAVIGYVCGVRGIREAGRRGRRSLE